MQKNNNAPFVYHMLKKVTAYENDTALPKQSLIDIKTIVWIFSVSRTHSLSSPFWLPTLCYCYSLPLEIPACAIKSLLWKRLGLRWTDELWATAERMGTEQIGSRDIITFKLFLVNIWFGAGKGAKKKQHTQFALKKDCKSSCKKAKLKLRDQFQLC